MALADQHGTGEHAERHPQQFVFFRCLFFPPRVERRRMDRLGAERHPGDDVGDHATREFPGIAGSALGHEVQFAERQTAGIDSTGAGAAEEVSLDVGGFADPPTALIFASTCSSIFRRVAGKKSDRA